MDLHKPNRVLCSNSTKCAQDSICDVGAGKCEPCWLICERYRSVPTDCNEYCKSTTTPSLTVRYDRIDRAKQPPTTNNDVTFIAGIILLAVTACLILMVVIVMLGWYFRKTTKDVKIKNTRDKGYNVLSNARDLNNVEQGSYSSKAISRATSDVQYGEANMFFPNKDGLCEKRSSHVRLPRQYPQTANPNQYTSWPELNHHKHPRYSNGSITNALNRISGRQASRLVYVKSLPTDTVSSTTQTNDTSCAQNTPHVYSEQIVTNHNSSSYQSANHNTPFGTSANHNTQRNIQNEEECSADENAPFLVKHSTAENSDTQETGSVTQSKSTGTSRSSSKSEQHKKVLDVINMKTHLDASEDEPDETEIKQMSQAIDEPTSSSQVFMHPTPVQLHSSQPSQPISVNDSVPVRDWLGAPTIYPYTDYSITEAAHLQHGAAHLHSQTAHLQPEVVQRLKQFHEHPNRETFEIIQKFSWVEGFTSKGQSIDVYVNFTHMEQAQALAELCHATGECPTKFHVRSNILDIPNPHASVQI